MKPSKTLQHACRVLRKRVQFKGAAFALPSALPFKMSNSEDTRAIQEATRIYVQAWILPVLEAIELGHTADIYRTTHLETGEKLDGSPAEPPQW